MKLFDVFFEFFKLGCYAFGGPSAHVGYFHERFVKRLKLIDESRFAELMSLTQFLPGPGSSQLGMTLGYHFTRKTSPVRGGLVAFLGFTLPSMILLIIASLTLSYGWIEMEWLVGLKVLAIVVVFDALRGMISQCCSTEPLKILALTSAIITLMWQDLWGQLFIIGATSTMAFFSQASIFVPDLTKKETSSKLFIPTRSLKFLAVFLLFLIVSPTLTNVCDYFKTFDSFYRSGALVFGGGHVVLPLLWEDLFIQSSMTNETFFAGYGLAQGVPGPMFTIASFLGASVNGSAGGVFGGILATVAIFLPGWLLLMAILPVWGLLRENAGLQRLLIMISASSVGLLGGAFVSPVLISGLSSPVLGALTLFLWGVKNYLKLPIGIMVIVALTGGLYI